MNSASISRRASNSCASRSPPRARRACASPMRPRWPPNSTLFWEITDMAALVIADHDGEQLNEGVRHVVTCARELGDEVDILVAGDAIGAVAESARRIAGVRAVKVFDAAHYRGSAAENVARAVTTLADGYTHVLAAATSYGKN